MLVLWIVHAVDADCVLESGLVVVLKGAPARGLLLQISPVLAAVATVARYVSCRDHDVAMRLVAAFSSSSVASLFNFLEPPVQSFFILARLAVALMCMMPAAATRKA